MSTYVPSLRNRIILIALVALAPAWAMMLFSISQQRAIIEADVMKDSLRAAELVAGKEEQVIEGARQVLMSLELYYQKVPRAPRECSEFSKSLIQQLRTFSNVGIANRLGEISCSARDDRQPPSVADSLWFQRALRSTQFTVGDYQSGRVTGNPVLVVTNPVMGSDHRVETVLFAAIDLGGLDESDMPDRMKSVPGAFLALVDRNGIVVSRFPETHQEEGAVRDPTLLGVIRRGDSAVIVGKAWHSEEYLYAVSPIRSRSPSRFVSVVLGVPERAAFAEARHTRNLNLALLGGVSVLMVAAFWVAANSVIVRRLEALFAAARSLTAGDLSARSGLAHERDELAHFAKAFDEMAQALEQREHEHQEAEARIRSSEEQLRRLQTHLQQVREDEQLRLAREIHDDLGQALTALKIDLSWIRKRSASEDPQAVQEKLDAMGRIIDEAMVTVHHVSSQLRPRILDDLGLAEAIEWQAEEFERRTGIQCEVAVSGDDMDLHPEQATALFRIFQEALTNVARHAEASCVRVSLEEDGGALILSIVDDGRGIRPDEIESPFSYGLMGIRERVNALAGDLEISGEVGVGTRLTVSVPRRGAELDKGMPT